MSKRALLALLLVALTGCGPGPLLIGLAITAATGSLGGGGGHGGGSGGGSPTAAIEPAPPPPPSPPSSPTSPPAPPPPPPAPSPPPPPAPPSPTNPPRIFGITPVEGATTGGTGVAVRGSGFSPGATVTVGGVPLVDVTVVDASTILGVTGPRSAGTVDVAVTDGSGSANLASSYSYVADGSPWKRSSNGLFGGDFRCFAGSPGSTLVVGASAGGIYWTRNAGRTWAPARGLGTFGFATIVAAPSNPSILYAGTYGNGPAIIEKSTDGGLTWSATSTTNVATGAISIAVSSQDPDVVFAVSAGGVLISSTDGGASWSVVTTGATAPLEAVGVDPLNAQNVLAGTYNGDIFRSTNGGASWTIVSPLSAATFAFDPTLPSRCYLGTYQSAEVAVSTDGGGTWGGSIPLPAGSGPVGGITIDPASGTVYAFVRGGGVFRSVNHGATWSALGVPDTAAGAFMLDPASSTHLYYAGFTLVFESTDGGTTWEPASTGLVEPMINAIVVDPRSPTTVYAAVQDQGVFKTTDGGGVWVARNAGLGAVKQFVDIQIDPTDSNTLYVTTTSGVFATADGGATWTPRNSGLDLLVFRLAIDPLAPATLYAGANSGLYKSVDSGMSWSLANGSVALDVAVDPVTPATVYLATSSSFLKSTDGGATWQTLSGVSQVARVVLDPRTTTTVYIGTAGHVFSPQGLVKSTDGGTTLTQLDTGIAPNDTSNGMIDIEAIAVDPSSPQTVYVGSWFDQGRFYKSTTGGTSWTALDLGIPNQAAGVIAIDPVNTRVLYAAPFGTTLLKSTTGGQ